MQTVYKPPLHTRAQACTITTSLYDLVEAVQTAIGPDNDELVVATVINVLQKGHATFLNTMGANHCN